jgi:hypothetical protein
MPSKGGSGALSRRGEPSRALLSQPVYQIMRDPEYTDKKGGQNLTRFPSVALFLLAFSLFGCMNETDLKP